MVLHQSKCLYISRGLSLNRFSLLDMGSRLSISGERQRLQLRSSKRKSLLNRPTYNDRNSQHGAASVCYDDDSGCYTMPTAKANKYPKHTSVEDCDYEKSKRRDNFLQRMLPSIPISTEVLDSGETEACSVLSPKDQDIDEVSRYPAPRFYGAHGKPCHQGSSNQEENQGSEAEAVVAKKEDDPGYKSCIGIVPSQTLNITIDSKDVAQEPINLNSNEPEYNEATEVSVSTNQDTEATYMQINGSDASYVGPDTHIFPTNGCDVPTESNEDGYVLQAPANNNERENSPVNPVPSQNPGSDYQYVQTDFNLNQGVLVGTNAHTTANPPGDHSAAYAIPRPKPQTVVSPTSELRIHGGVVLYPVQAGTKRTISGATVEVPIALVQELRLRCVEVGWSNNIGEFPVLALGQHPITRVLHCLPHGSAFSVPVIVTVSLPAIEGQFEIFYSPTDVEQTPVWTKLRTVDSPENTCFTDNRNFVTLRRNRSVAHFELRHFCAFLIVENGRLLEAKKTKAIMLLKDEFGRDYCNIIVRVVLGCLEDVAKQKMMEKLQKHMSEGFRMLDDVEFNLFASESKSSVKVKISQIHWIPKSDVTHGNLDTGEFQLHQLWNDGTVDVMFWQWSELTSGVKPKAFAATVHIQQDDRHDLRTKLFHSLESPLPLNTEPKAFPVHDHMTSQRREKLEKDFPSGGCLAVAESNPGPACGSDCSSDCKFELDLHSNSSEPEVKDKNFDQQPKGIEA